MDVIETVKAMLRKSIALMDECPDPQSPIEGRIAWLEKWQDHATKVEMYMALHILEISGNEDEIRLLVSQLKSKVTHE